MNPSERLLNLATQFSAISAAFSALCNDIAAQAQHSTDATKQAVNEQVAQRMDSVEFAKKVAQYVDSEAVAEAAADLIRDNVLEQVSVTAEDVAQYVEVSDIAESIDVRDIAAELADNFSAEDIAAEVSVAEVAQHLDYKALAAEIVRALVAQQQQSA